MRFKIIMVVELEASNDRQDALALATRLEDVAMEAEDDFHIEVFTTETNVTP